jgi:hypothetical protein
MLADFSKINEKNYIKNDSKESKDLQFCRWLTSEIGVAASMFVFYLYASVLFFAVTLLFSCLFCFYFIVSYVCLFFAKDLQFCGCPLKLVLLQVYFCLFVCLLFVCLFVCLFVYLFVCLFVCLFHFFLISLFSYFLSFHSSPKCFLFDGRITGK